MSSASRSKVYVVDDSRIVRERLIALLSELPHVEVIGQADLPVDAIAGIRNLKPTAVILDISMPVVSGLEAARELKKTGNPAKIVFLTVHEESDFVRESFASGGSAYVIKPRLATDLVAAIREALAGHTFISPSLSMSN